MAWTMTLMDNFQKVVKLIPKHSIIKEKVRKLHGYRVIASLSNGHKAYDRSGVTSGFQ